MLLKRFHIMLGVTLISLLVAVACAPVLESEGGAQVQSSAEESASNQVQSDDGGQVVEVTPMSETEMAAQPEGQSEPGAGAPNEESQEEPGAQGGQPQPGTMVVYTDDMYKFSISYPADFVLRTQPDDKLAPLQPKPVDSFILMNPVTASSDIVDHEPADLEIRVHDVGQIPSLENWLTSNGVLPTDGAVPVKPFQTNNVSGVEICASTLIAPGCSYYVLGNGWIYQLTPATVEGEMMVDTFMLIP